VGGGIILAVEGFFGRVKLKIRQLAASVGEGGVVKEKGEAQGREEERETFVHGIILMKDKGIYHGDKKIAEPA